MNPSDDASPSKPRNIKVVLIGNEGVGKTSIIGQLKDHRFNSNTTVTVGAMFVNKSISLDGEKYDMQIWDTAGQERYRNVAPIYFRDAHGVLVVYDCTNRKSFEDVDYWMKEIIMKAEKKIAIVILGNKTDLVGEIQEKEAMLLAEDHQCTHVGVSAKTGENIEEGLKFLLKKIVTSGVMNDITKHTANSVSVKQGNALRFKKKQEKCKC